MVRDDMIIVVSDRVELFVENGPLYKTIIGEILDSGELLAVVPSRLGVRMNMREEDLMFLAFFRESGRYVAPVQATGFSEEGNVRLVTLKLMGDPQREQRRGFFRLPVLLDVLVCPYPQKRREYSPNANDIWKDEVIETARTVNISVPGVAIKTKTEMKAGEKYLLKIYLNWPKESSPPYMICGEVKRVNYTAERMVYQSGLHFIDSNDMMSGHLARYILVQQQKMIQRKRFIEGD